VSHLPLEKVKCEHCETTIRHFDGVLWHDDGLVFPQYCQTKYSDAGEILPAQLHAPLLMKNET
jgi:hypothetical protein